MNNARRLSGLIVGCMIVLTTSGILAADWPQWRGPNRDGKVTGFTPPSTWPSELTQKWKVTVGTGDATPALVGEKLYVFCQQGSDEDTLCLDANTGKTLWQDKYSPHKMVSGPASRHPGPRSSPAVAEGKVVTLGYAGILSCLDADSGKMIWRKEFSKEFPKTEPVFWTASSPIVADGMGIAHVGGQGKGAVVAFELGNGDAKWQTPTEGPSYSSPVLLSAGGVKQIVDESEKAILGVSLVDGKILWRVPFEGRGMGGYNVATPIVEGDTVICTGSGRGARALKIEKEGEGFAARELWSNPDASTQFSTAVLKDGMLFGLTDKGLLFCIDARDGKTLWVDKTKRSNFGSVLDAGPDLLVLTPDGQLTVIKPNAKHLEQVAQIKVPGNSIYAHPVISGNRIYIKDRDSLALYTIE